MQCGVEEVQPLLEDAGEASIKLGGLAVFHNEEEDVLYLQVESPQLEKLNEKLGTLPNVQTYSKYRPHLTIAYLKPEEGDKYLSLDNPAQGIEYRTERLLFS